MTVAVEFDHVSKRFILEKSRSQSFQEVMVNLFKRERRESQAFWALNDVTFSLEKGKTVGFIGANGAGKSTALKMISSIIEPTSGEVRSYGRVGALLELGAGFHPDLTGRENIFLNGAILGLSRDEIRGKVDDIISFAELERFIDVPVKHYSSGMYVRLGFSVAIHTKPEILLVDEVLSVGDANFQHKCMEQIAQLRNSGVTIVLVSHSLETIQSFCEHVIWFD
ncbi:MAG: ABC transporter ATP-binding protein, partial [Anaerolineae bacterium]|nr:ABC transporter ATP-binding protein [Anaerolineae bacterium]